MFNNACAYYEHQVHAIWGGGQLNTTPMDRSVCNPLFFMRKNIHTPTTISTGLICVIIKSSSANIAR